jgi:FkbM family methyltransferase
MSNSDATLAQRAATGFIYAARRLLYRTPVHGTRLSAWIHARVFEAAAPDLTRPIPFRGTQIYVDPEDRSMVPSIVGGYFETSELDVFEALIADASVFLDVGANFGIYSLLGCRRTQSLHAYAFEPIEENQAILRRNIDLHGLGDRITIEPCAVSDREGSTMIHLAHSGTHSISRSQGSTGTRQIPTVTLDAVIERLGISPDVVKIDVEGHEVAVIDGALQMLADSAPTILIEYVPSAHADVESLIDRLSAYSPRCYIIDEIEHTVREDATAALPRNQAYDLVLTHNPSHERALRSFVGR